ncbi:MAG: hypothetical protein KC431_07830 [Myxococcales bacterium]|nr:hypothetical protein [Myxococcales bacterium]
MRLQLPTPEQAAPILRAFAEVAAASSAVDERQQAMIAAARSILGVQPGPLAPITPAALAAAVEDEQVRRQIVQGMIVLSLLDEEAERAELERIEAYAAALAVAPEELRNLRQLIEGQTLGLRLSVARRVWFVDRLKAAWAEGGFRWLARSLATLKLMNDEPLAAKYRALADYPVGSLGRCYHDHMREQGFPLPGEKGSQIEPVFIHDLTHLISGYGTDAAGEILAAAFSAGNREKEPFTYIFFVLCQFHLGVRFSGFAPSASGAFDPARALWAARRGMEVEVDLTEEWDYWADLGLTVPQVREKLGMTLAPEPA